VWVEVFFMAAILDGFGLRGILCAKYFVNVTAQ
jgi:hypothetical protein